jgi:hypothetical protein
MVRLIAIALSALCLIGGGIFTWSHLSEKGEDDFLCQAGFCGVISATYTNEPINPFGWSDLAEQKGEAGDMAGAREAFRRSLQLGPNIPQVLIRYVNFEVANGQIVRVLPQLRHILELTNAYDNLVFRYVVRSEMDSKQVLAEVIPDPGRGSAEEMAKRAAGAGGHATAPDGEGRPRGDAARAWTSYLLAERRPEAESTYGWLAERGGVTPGLRNQWIEYLIQVRKDYAKAVATWAAAHTDREYPGENRVFNGGFVRERTEGRLDWSLATHPRVTAKMGDGLRLTFDGQENIAYGHLSQQTFVPAGAWRFVADADAEGLSTDQRPFFRVHDTFDARRLDVTTAMAPEPMTVDFTVPTGGSWVTITFLRRQSGKFDNKLKGVIRVKKVTIKRVGGGGGAADGG